MRSVSLEQEPLPVGRDTVHVVFALSRAEASAFFGGLAGLSFEGACTDWLETGSVVDPAWWEESLRRTGPEVLVTAWSCPPIPESWALSDSCPLRYVCSVTGSVKPRIPRRLIERGIPVTNWGGLVSWAVAEHALLLVLGLLRSEPYWRECVSKPFSDDDPIPRLPTKTLRRKKVGLHGFGAVARDLVTMLRPFDVDLCSFSEGVPPSLMAEFGVRACGSIRELFYGREVLIECEGLNDCSRGSVTGEVLDLLAPGAVFVNVGRGAVVDEEAIAGRAASGRLRVGLDVFRCEPLPEDSPLLGYPGVMLSPHLAGPTSDQFPLCGAKALENIERFLRGKPLERLVTLEIYDRAT